MRVEEGCVETSTPEPEADGWWWKVWRAGLVSVLVVSDRGAWSGELAALLEGEGYAVRIDDGGASVLEPGCPFDVAIVDLSLSARSVTAVLIALRSRSSLPILAVPPAGHREPVVLSAYAAGADQTVVRSDRPHELLARVRALLRRSPPRLRSLLVSSADVGSISLDLASGLATVAGQPVSLTPREREILQALLQRSGRVVTRAQLAGPRRSKQADRALDSIVRNLRHKVEAAEGHRRIVAVRGVGFRILPDREL